MCVRKKASCVSDVDVNLAKVTTRNRSYKAPKFSKLRKEEDEEEARGQYPAHVHIVPLQSL
jgi:hypothetical protein